MGLCRRTSLTLPNSWRPPTKITSLFANNKARFRFVYHNDKTAIRCRLQGIWSRCQNNNARKFFLLCFFSDSFSSHFPSCKRSLSDTLPIPHRLSVNMPVAGKKTGHTSRANPVNVGTWCMKCFRSTMEAEAELINSGNPATHPFERVAIECGYQDAASSRCVKCNKQGDSCNG